MDIGGTKIKAGILSSDGEIKLQLVVKTPTQQGREGILACIIKITQQLQDMHSEPIHALGIGTAGRVDRATGTVVYATDNLPGWMGTQLKSNMEVQFPFPVFVDNDVNTAALGEGWLGAGIGKKHYILVTLGTGIGGALVYDGKLIAGPRGGVGEVGHMILYPNGLPCNCGQSGCLEQYISGTALNQLAKRINMSWGSRELMVQLERKEPRATEAMMKFIDDLSVGLISMQNMFDPELIILGGGVMDSHPLWWSELEARIQTHTPQYLSIAPAILGNQAGMLGAAWYALDKWNEPNC
jgi:glucokinase